MAGAEVGDDVFGEDPTVNALQRKVAQRFGMEAGLFVPSGVMSNQLALKVLSRAGEEVITDHKGHIFNYETAAAAMISSVQINPVRGSRGKLDPELISGAMRGGRDWEPLPSIVVVENTTNKGGGACYSRHELQDIRLKATELGLSVHLDGARIWNAVTATGIEEVFFGTIADTMTVSFSKGLGAPVGSMLLGREKDIEEARRYRKMLGGGMRQVGVLAAAADYALEHHLPLLKEDHRRARALAETISDCSRLDIDLESVETNILVFELHEDSVEEAVASLQREEVLMVPFGSSTLRATFHHQVSDRDLEQVQAAMVKLFN